MYSSLKSSACAFCVFRLLCDVYPSLISRRSGRYLPLAFKTAATKRFAPWLTRAEPEPAISGRPTKKANSPPPSTESHLLRLASSVAVLTRKPPATLAPPAARPLRGPRGDRATKPTTTPGTTPRPPASTNHSAMRWRESLLCCVWVGARPGPVKGGGRRSGLVGGGGERGEAAGA